jgi:hypothetical protein
MEQARPSRVVLNEEDGMVINERMVGSSVFDREGHLLGSVKEIVPAGSAFKVNVPMLPDFWLPFDVIQTVSEMGVMLTVDSEHLRDVVRDRPEVDEADARGRDFGIDATRDQTGTLNDTDELGLREGDGRTHRAA